MSAPLPFRVSRRLSKKLSNAVSRTVRDLRGQRMVARNGEVLTEKGMEALESRRLMTTLVGGDSFEFQTPDPNNPSQLITNRIVLQGNIVAELVGGTLNNVNNTVTISDIPGAFNQSEIRGQTGFSYATQNAFLGGVGGGSGTTPVASNGQTIQYSDPFDGQGGVSAGNASFNFKALATDAQNVTYGFNVVRIGAIGTVGERAIVQLVKLDTATGTTGVVIADLNSAISAATAGSNFTNANGVTDVTAAAFDPVSGLLYFVVRGRTAGIPANGTAAVLPTTQQMFTLKVGTTSTATISSVKAISGSFQQSPNNDTIVTALAFDQTSSSTRTAYGYVVGNVSGQGSGGYLFNVNLNNTDNINNPRQVLAGTSTVSLTGITGLTIVGDDANAAATQIYAVESSAPTLPGGTALVLANQASGPEVMSIPLADNGTGVARPTLLGRLTQPGATGTTILGNDLEDLTYNPALRNPFTGQLGVMVSIDNTTGQMAFVDTRNRFPGVAAFELYIAQSDANATITWGIVPDVNPSDPGATRLMQPFTGSAGTLRVRDTGGNVINLASPQGIGGVFLGTKTSGHTDGNLNNIPVLTSTLSTALGVAPGGIQKTGIVSSASLLSALTNSVSLADRLLGEGVTDVTGLAVTSAGTVYAVDSDFVDGTGTNIAFNQLAVIDRTTGKVIGTPTNITSSTGSTLSTGRGMTLTENDKILAIFLQQVGGTSGGGGGGSTGNGLDLSGSGQSAVSLSVSGDGKTGYVLAETSTAKYLYRFDKDASGNVTFTSLGQIVDADGNTIAQAQALGLSSTGQLYTVGFDAGNPNPTQSTGGTGITTGGATARNITYAPDGSIYLLAFGAGGVSVRLVPRDPTTGELLNTTSTPTFITVNGSTVQNLNALASSSSGTLYGIGTSVTGVTPNQNQGILSDATGTTGFNYRGFTQINGTYYALTSNGATLVLRSVTTTASGAVVAGAFNAVGQTVSDGTHAAYTEATRTAGLVHADDVRYSSPTGGAGHNNTAVMSVYATADSAGDDTHVYFVGYGADQFIPTASAASPVVGQLAAQSYTALTVVGFSTVERFADTGVLPTVQNSGAGLADTLITQAAIDNAKVAGGLTGGAVTGVTYSLPYVFSRTNGTSRDTSTGGVLSGGSSSFQVSVIGQAWNGPNPLSVAGSASLAALEGTLSGLATLANGVVETGALGSAGNVLYTTGFDIDSPIPALPIKGNLGTAFGSDLLNGTANVRAMTFESYTGAETDAAVSSGDADATLGAAYVLVADAQGFANLYKMTRDATTGGIASFGRVDTNTNGLIDDVTGTPISFAYTLTADTQQHNVLYTIGSPSPGQSTATMFLYKITLTTTNGVTTAVASRVRDASNNPVTLPSPSRIWKASAMDSSGDLFMVLDGDGGVPGIQDGTQDNSVLYVIPAGTSTPVRVGAMGNIGFGGALATGAGAQQAVSNANIRAMQFKTQTDGREVLLALDSASNQLAQYNLFGGFKSVPLAGSIDGATGTVSGVNGTQPVVVGIVTSQPGQLPTGLNTFAIDQYGRSFAVQSTGANTPARVITSPNEIFEIETAADQDGDRFQNEITRLGYMANPDGTAFTDTITNVVNNQNTASAFSTATTSSLIVTYRNIYASSEHPWEFRTVGSTKVSLANVERMATLATPGGTGDTEAPQLNNGVWTLTPMGSSDGRISINGNASTQTTADQVAASASAFQGYANIRGLSWVQGPDGAEELIGLNVGQGNPNKMLSGGGPELVGFGYSANSSSYDVRLNQGSGQYETQQVNGIAGSTDVTYGTRTLTDNSLDYTPSATGVADSAFTTSNPFGFAVDALGRFYSIDNSYADPAFGTIAALEGSREQVSLFKVQTTAGTNVSATQVAKLAEQLDLTGQQSPNPFTVTPFTAIAIWDANGDGTGDTVYMVQRDLRFGDNGVGSTGIDRLVSFTIPGTPGGSASFTRYNSGFRSGAIEINYDTNTANPSDLSRTTKIRAMDFNSSGQLIGLNQEEIARNILTAAPQPYFWLSPAAAGTRATWDQLVQIIDLRQPTTTGPDAVGIGDRSSAPLQGVTIVGTAISQVKVVSSPTSTIDSLLANKSQLDLYAVTPGGATTDAGAITVAGSQISDANVVTAIASDPVSGLMYFVLRAVTGTAGDILFSLDPNTRQATAIGAIRAGGASTTIKSLAFGAPDASGNAVLIGLNDPTTGTGDRQLVKIDLSDPTASTALPGTVSDTAVGIASDTADTRSTSVPAVNRGRFYAVEAPNGATGSVVLRVTPQNLYQFSDGTDGDGLAHFTSAASGTGAVGDTGGLALFDTIRALDFTPATYTGGVDQLYGVKNPLATNGVAQVSRLMSFPSSTTTVAGLPQLVLGGNSLITVASSNPFPGHAITNAVTSSQTALITDLAFLPGSADGTARAVDVSQGGQKRLIDFSLSTTTAAIARTDPGDIADAYVGFAVDNSSLFYTVNTSVSPAQLLTEQGTGFFPAPSSSGNGGGNGGGAGLGVPVLGTIDPAADSSGTSVFTPVTGTVSGQVGRLPTSITDVKAMAYDKFATHALYIVDQNDTLIQISPTDGSIIRTVGVIHDAITGQTLNVGSMTFDGSGKLVVQDLTNSRLVDVSTTTAAAGLQSATSVGSLPNTVGAISYDPVGKRILAADNSTGINTTANTSGTSSQLLQISGNLTATGQDIKSVFIGGTVTGDVSFAGSVGTFYAGWIITGPAASGGDVAGLGATDANPDPGSFHVMGNLQQLVTLAPLGGGSVTFSTTSNGVGYSYNSGTDVLVNGRIGSVRSYSDIVGTIRALGSNVATGTAAIVSETEVRDVPGPNQSDADLQGIDFQAGQLHLGNFHNDSAASAQPLFPSVNADGTNSGVATVDGVIESSPNKGDSIDFYSVGLMGGQTINVQLFSGVGQLYFGIFDTDGRLVYSSHSLNGNANYNGTFQFKAPRPGLYSIAVAQPGDTTFDGAITATLYETTPLVNSDFTYELTVSGLGNMSIGAVVASGSILDHSPELTTGNVFDFSTIYAAQGDIGQVLGENGLFGDTTSVAANTVRAQTGSINAIVGGQIGRSVIVDPANGISVSAGSNIGLIQATAGPLVLNENVIPTSVTSYTGAFADFNPAFTSVGGSIQTIKASGIFLGNVFANGGLGNLLVGSMATLEPSYINVNADNTGADGTIDMIDVGGDIGTLGGGGPVIYTNGGGNIRYMRAAGAIYRDRAFGGGTDTAVTLDPGAGLKFVDDSGSVLYADFDPRVVQGGTDVATGLAAPQISYTNYPVRSGGSVLMVLEVSNLGTTTTLPLDAQQLTFTSSGTGGSVDIGTISFFSANLNPLTITQPATDAQTGAAVVGPSTFAQTGSNSYGVVFGGTAKINIGLINVMDTPATRQYADIVTLQNTTGGELLDLRANDIGTLSWSGSVGVAQASVTGTEVTDLTDAPEFAANNLAQFTGAHPIVGHAFALLVDNIAVLESNRAIGTVSAANIGRITANADGKDDPSVYEGIVGAIYAHGNGQATGQGIINEVDFGEGIAFTGSGDIANGLIMANGRLDLVQGSGDVRGVIASHDSIGTISIGGNGAVIGGLFAVYTARPNTPDEVFELMPINNDTNTITFIIPTQPNSTKNTPVPSIDTIRASGGMIGTEVMSAGIGQMSVGGFGMFASFLQSEGSGTLGSLSVGGYGIRGGDMNGYWLDQNSSIFSFQGLTIDGFNNVGSITANGSGSQLPITSVTRSATQSLFTTIDPFTGYPVGRGTDVAAYLAVTAATPTVDGITNTGVIEDVMADGNAGLGSISAWQIRGSLPGTVNTILNFAGGIGSLKTKSIINGLTVKAGRITTFAPAGDVLALDLTVSGTIQTFKINGNLASNSIVAVQGPNASLKTFQVKGNFDGSLDVSGHVGTITVGGNLTTGTITIHPTAGKGAALSKLQVGGSMSGASLDVIGDVGTITTAGSLGTTGDSLVVHGSIGSIKVGTNKKLPAGKVLGMNVTADGQIKSVVVNGRIVGAITAAGSIGSIKVQTDGDANRTAIGGAITSTAGAIGTVSVTNGDVGANISAFNNLKTISVVRGSINAGTTIATTNGAIGSVNVKAGNLLGSITAGDAGSSGQRAISSINVDGHVGDGTNPVSIKAATLKSFKSGTLFSGTTVNVAGALSSLTVNGDVQAGATVNAGTIGKRKITGAINGTINITG